MAIKQNARRVEQPGRHHETKAVEQRLWAMFSQVPKEVSLVGELLAERRAEAGREDRQ